MLSLRTLLPVVAALTALLHQPTRAVQPVTIDAFRYASTREADAAWRPVPPSPGALRAAPGALTWPIPFHQDRDRVYWDRPVQLDLSAHETLRLDLTCPEPEAIRSFALYLKSGNGWYIWSRPLAESGRQTLDLMKADFQTEGSPAGWHKIEAVRISPWKGAKLETTITLHHLSAHSPGILVVRGSHSQASEQNVARRATQRISQWLSDQSLLHAVLDDHAVTPARLRNARVVILPYNPTLPASLRQQLHAFTQRGGRIMVFYSADAELASMLGFRMGDYHAAQGPGQWAAMRFVDPPSLRVPPRLHQESWNIRPVHPASPSARVIAWWEDARGQDTGHPAWLLSDRGVWMSHILLQGDDEAKRTALGALVAQLDSEQWSRLAAHAVHRTGKIGPYPSLTETLNGIRHQARNAHNSDQVESLLRAAEEQNRRMHQLYGQRRYPQTVDMHRALQRNLLSAYAMVQRSDAKELRGVWDHSGTGLYPGHWDRTARLLAEHGINTLFVNVMWGGLAHYASDVLPRSATFRMYGDQLQQAIAAARAHGLEVHVWVVCWNLTGAPPEFVAEMRRKGRTIQSADGEAMPWLNPAHPDNVKLLVDSLNEVASKYDIDGIHLDYIRYPNRRACYSDYTRTRFEEWLGRRVTKWPVDALPNGPLDEAYRRFRVDQINLAVRAVHQQMGRRHSKVKVSAAVWGGYPDVIQSIAQDWPPWLTRGEVDFVVPMNYTTDYSRFAHLTRTQLQLPGTRGKLFPGLGVTASESQLSPDQVIQQISGLRELGAGGWVLFDLNNTLRAETLPALRLGITAP